MIIKTVAVPLPSLRPSNNCQVACQLSGSGTSPPAAPEGCEEKQASQGFKALHKDQKTKTHINPQKRVETSTPKLDPNLQPQGSQYSC